MTDVTDATFEQAVLERSFEVPVVVDLWAPWCGPCKTLTPILEAAVARAGGTVELAKVNVDENPMIGGSFQVQSIPAVFAISEGKIVDQFLGAQPPAVVEAFIEKLAPSASEADLLVARGMAEDDEALVRQALELEPDHREAICYLAARRIAEGASDEALALLARVPESAETRALAASARLAAQHVDPTADVDALLDDLLDRVRDDADARQEFLDLLETLGPDDLRTGRYRRALASRLF